MAEEVTNERLLREIQSLSARVGDLVAIVQKSESRIREDIRNPSKVTLHSPAAAGIKKEL